MKFARAIWRLLVGIKDGLVLIFMLLFFGFLYVALSARPEGVGEGVLAFDLNGSVVEQPSTPTFAELAGGGSPVREYRLRDLVAALDAARDDDRVKAVALDLESFTGGGQAAMTDLEAQHAVTRRDCGSGVEALLGGPPAQLRERYAQLSPIHLLPLRVPQWLVHGTRDPVVSVDTVMHYAETARRKGDRVTLGVTSNAGHYEPVVPGSTTWMTVQRAVVAALLE